MNACFNATIPYVVGPSCIDQGSCRNATIGSVDSSCNERGSCSSAQIGSVNNSCKDVSSCKSTQLSGVDLINSCQKSSACQATGRGGAFDELINCCNDEPNVNGFGKCQGLVGAGI